MKYADAIERLKQLEEPDKTESEDSSSVSFGGSVTRPGGSESKPANDEPTGSVSFGGFGSRGALHKTQNITPERPSNDDAERDPSLIRELNRLTSDLDLSTQAVYEQLTDADIQAWQNGQIDTSHLRVTALSVRDERDRQAGKIPDGYTYPGTCEQCGPVWLSVTDKYVESCPWCENRNNGWPIPRPRSITCATCQHFQRTNHPHLGHCGIGVQSYAPAGLWDTDHHACRYWTKSK